MDTIDAFLASHPYAAQTKRTYSDVLHRLLAAVKPDSLTAAGLVHFLEVSGWGNKRQCMALAAIQKYLAWRFGPDHPARMARLQRIEGKPQRALTQQVALQLLASFNPSQGLGALRPRTRHRLARVGAMPPGNALREHRYTDIGSRRKGWRLGSGDL